MVELKPIGKSIQLIRIFVAIEIYFCSVEMARIVSLRFTEKLHQNLYFIFFYNNN